MFADPEKSRLASVQNSYSDLRGTADYRDVFADKDIDAVVIASPTKTHFSVSKEALEAGKHVLCEKPLAMTPDECDELKILADRQKKILMVGHIFLFNAGIRWLKNYLQAGRLGKIYYAYSTRTNLGPFRYDVNALWDLAPHDISIFNYLFDARPSSVSARGHKCLGETLEDVAFAALDYPENIMANIHVSWLDPKKVRQITIVGDKEMVVWDDLETSGPIKVYDKHVEKTEVFYETYGEFQLLSKEGSIMIPNVDAHEPLEVQTRYFLECVEKNSPPVIADAGKGRDVVDTLCAIEQSLGQNGITVQNT